MKPSATLWALAFAIWLCATGAFGQDQGQNPQPTDPLGPIQPISPEPTGRNAKQPAAAGRGMASPYQPQTNDQPPARPDENTLAGAQFATPGSFGAPRTIFDPAISVSELAESSRGTSAKTTVTPMTTVSGVLNFDREGARNHFIAFYSGGDSIANNSPLPAGPFHNLTLTEQIRAGRWYFLLRDDFLASSGAVFGGAGTGGPGLLAELSSLLGSSLVAAGQQFTPNDTIGSGSAMRYRNATLGQAEYYLSRRTILTLAGSYGLLHFNSSGYISSHMVNGQAGIDHELDAVNSIAILGGYGKIDYTGTVNSTSDYLGALAYGRKITGRLAFQVSAGAQEINANRPSGNFQRWEPSVNSSLSYKGRRGGISASYTRGLTTGSGAFFGAIGDTISGSGQHQFTRYWTGSVDVGYAINTSLAPAGSPTSRFDNWFVGANLGRHIGFRTQIDFNYGVQKQTGPSVCPVASCGISGYLQTAGMTVNWHLRRVGE